MENRIVRVDIRLRADGTYIVEVTKEFSPENGGGEALCQEDGGRDIHRALDVAREMVTLSPTTRPGPRANNG
jgi:hypothetical protein